MLTLQGLLTPDELAFITERLAAAAFVDGAETAVSQAKEVKHNRQLPRGGPAAIALEAVLAAAFERHEALRALAMPRHLVPARFARYEAGMAYGWHVDSPVMAGEAGVPVRTDLACTVFLVPPGSYGGGELTIQTPLGHLSTKLPAGDAVVYPADSVHRVEAVTHGVRLVAVTWMQSLVASVERRQLLQDLFQAMQALRVREAQAPELLRLGAVHGNLLRMWAQP